MNEKSYQVNWKKASIALGLSLGLLGPVSFYGPEILTAKAAETSEASQATQTESSQQEEATQEDVTSTSKQTSQINQDAEINTPVENDLSSQKAEEESDLDQAKSIAKDWVNSVEYVDRDEAGNPQAYSYTRNYQTHRINVADLNKDTREDWAVHYLVDSQAEAEKAQYDQASTQLAESGIDVKQILDQDEANYYILNCNIKCIIFIQKLVLTTFY